MLEMDDWQMIGHYLKELFCERPVLKTIIAVGLGVGQMLFGPWKEVYLAIFLLWLADWFLGTLCAWLDTKDQVKSRRWFHSGIKAFLYGGLLFLSYQVRLVIAGEIIGSGLCSIIIITETLSVLENLQRIGKLFGVDLPIITQIIKAIQGRQAKIVKDIGGE